MMFVVPAILSVVAVVTLANADPIQFRRQTAATPFGEIPDSCTSSCQPLVDVYSPCFVNGQAQVTCFCTDANLEKAAACAQCLVNVGFAAEDDEQDAIDVVAQFCSAQNVATPTLTGGGSATITPTATDTDTSSAPTSTSTDSSSNTSTSLSSSSSTSSSTSSSVKSSTSSSSAPAATTTSGGMKRSDVGVLGYVGAVLVGLGIAMF
ncbi:hypothetical protein SISSUDRAFT_1128756 [Sistotremastrum suecicum HHB10207 ss-3]|uniref:Extracellular membrane protein CFEM domain-containing protein n=1 Tax=Sistotremastrum suecicum HHB10207 ss-3 TaxID=1314776 RepID=A0A166DFD2_9AGAM|nr:hypothetical protein SISSUDRAFT_1128756 [Sistotremastrum suecicum HHB10207 ss-3]